MAAAGAWGACFVALLLASPAGGARSELLKALDRDDVAWLSTHAPLELLKAQRLASPDVAAPAMAVGATAGSATRQHAPPPALVAEQLANMASAAHQIVAHRRSASSFNVTFQPIDTLPPGLWSAALGTNFSLMERAEAAGWGGWHDGDFLGEHMTRSGTHRPSAASPAPLGASRSPQDASGPAPGSRVDGVMGLDWVDLGVVPAAVAFQGACRSCWAFVASDAVAASAQLAAVASSGAAPGQWHIPFSAVPRSAQQFVSCDKPATYGCMGGTPAQALGYARRNPIVSAAAYPYAAACLREGQQPPPACALPALSKAGLDSPELASDSPVLGYRTVRRGDEDAMLDALQLGPLTAGIDASSFQLTHYSSGIFDYEWCGRSLNHAVLIVGHGRDEVTGTPYWRVKNSWSSGWGERGYIRLVRGRNMCGIADLVAYPVWRAEPRWEQLSSFARAHPEVVGLVLVGALLLVLGCVWRYCARPVVPAGGGSYGASTANPTAARGTGTIARAYLPAQRAMPGRSPPPAAVKASAAPAAAEMI